MNRANGVPLFKPLEELDHAKRCPGGWPLSPGAQALLEEEGARRFLEHHRGGGRTACAFGHE